MDDNDTKIMLTFLLLVAFAVAASVGSYTYASAKCSESGGQFSNDDWGCHPRGEP